MSFRNFLLKRGIMSSDTEVVVRAAVFGKAQETPIAMTVAATITVAALINGLITGTHTTGGDAAYTLPTGADMDAALTAFFINNDSFEFTIINLSVAAADTITLTAGDAFTIVGEPIIGAIEAVIDFPSSATYRVRRTAANTFVAYRL